MLRLDLRPEIARYDTSKYHITYKITSVAPLKSQGRKQVKKVEKLSFCQALVFCKIFTKSLAWSKVHTNFTLGA